MLDKIPLTINEFIDPLSYTKYCDNNQYGDIRCMIEVGNKYKGGGKAKKQKGGGKRGKWVGDIHLEIKLYV